MEPKSGASMTFTPKVKVESVLIDSLFLDGIREEDVSELMTHASVKRFAKGNHVFMKSDRSDEIYLIVEGRIKLSAVSLDGREALFGIRGAGDILGEDTLFRNSQRIATAVALEPSQLVAIPKERFMPFLESHPQITLRLLELVSQRLSSASSLYEESMLLDLPSRLANVLCRLCAEAANAQDGLDPIELKLTQQELATWVGSSRESINRLLRRWEGEGAIKLLRGKIAISSRAHLQRVASQR